MGKGAGGCLPWGFACIKETGSVFQKRRSNFSIVGSAGSTDLDMVNLINKKEMVKRHKTSRINLPFDILPTLPRIYVDGEQIFLGG